MAKTKSSKTIYQDQWTKVVQNEFFLSGTESIRYTFVDRADGVLGLVTNDKDNVLLMEQYRVPIKSYSWELPGGGIDSHESKETALKREILEETGVSIKQVKFLENFYPMTSLSTEQEFLYSAKTTDKIPNKIHGEADELIREVKFFSADEITKMLNERKISEIFTVYALKVYFLATIQ